MPRVSSSWRALDCRRSCLVEEVSLASTFDISRSLAPTCSPAVRSFPLTGYTVKNVARTWAYETGIVLGEELDENLPYND